MIQLISIVCVASILLGLLGLTLVMLRRQRHRSAFIQFAQQHDFTIFDTQPAIEPFYEALNSYDFFRTGSRSRIRLLIRKPDRHSSAELMLATLTHSGMSQSFTDEYALIRWQLERLHLPHFSLQPKGYAVERALNALLVGKQPQIPLTAYPSLSEQYQCTGTEPEAISRTLHAGLGDFLEEKVQQSLHRSIECFENQFIYYTYLKDEIRAGELEQLYEESHRVLDLLGPVEL